MPSAVRVADCVPVLLADPRTGRVAAVHAGWRGVVADVLGAAVRHLGHSRSEGRESSASSRAASDFLAAIGPCIGPCCFEVGADVGETIARSTTSSAISRRDEARGKVFVDLRAAVRAQLRELGLSDAAIEDVPDRTGAGCTRCDAQRFFSYRRDGDASGRLDRRHRCALTSSEARASARHVRCSSRGMIQRHRYRNLVELGEESCKKFAERPLFGTRTKGGYVWTSYREFQALVDALRGGLASLGVRTGDKVAIVSNNRVEWAVAAYATYGLGATFVPMYEAQRPDEWQFILDDCGAKVVFGSKDAVVSALEAMRPSLPQLTHVIGIERPLDGHG